MTEFEQETERKYEAPSVEGAAWLPDLVGVGGIVSVMDRGSEDLDAVYYDTEDLRLAGASATLRRRTGGADAGWHLKLPLSGDSREEVRAPLSDTLPDTLRDLALSRTRGADVRPVVRIRTTRGVRQLVGSGNTVLAELSIDSVRAESMSDAGTRTSWVELEVELAPDTDPALLDNVDKTLRKNGVDRAHASSKLARALEETSVGAPGPPAGRVAEAMAPGSAGAVVLRYVEDQIHTLVKLDPAVRRDVPDSVHRMRVSCRRLRSVLRSYRSVLDRKATDPVREELKWLGSELGAERDQEVLLERLSSRIGALSPELVFGPVSARLQIWDVGTGAEARRRTLDALNSPRYLALLDSLATLTERPPLRAKAARKPENVTAKAIVKEYGRLADRVAHALELAPGTERDMALHEARKAAKRTRYATEPARAALGKPAKRLGKRVKAVQKVLGDHQDSVVARDALRNMAVAAHMAGETGFVWGLLYGQEQAVADRRERELPAVWADASRSGLRKALGR
ncbi:CYTH and CHAD domain-containing protein [Streptomyces europaeiscabiei]|uniref:CYTH and CHAD domain-containing protein n=1 Tax=Streptomyces europaeiscabiei TaxID=146819 RepID=UPI0029A6162D|nr:CYTH and CHAD domain-containing protein [Streptomyces europaeiscabiei]MDX3697229.1 CYTH and CHAD domain-containing protein [Streptomyces europaeiscabiei]